MTDNNPNQLSYLSNCLPIWQQPKVIYWSQILAESYRQLVGRELIDRSNTPEELAEALFHAPFVVVSHGTQADPILNYGNLKALQLWSLSWQELTQTPSRLTAEPVNRATRSAMLEQVAQQGYVRGRAEDRSSTLPFKTHHATFIAMRSPWLFGTLYFIPFHPTL